MGWLEGRGTQEKKSAFANVVSIMGSDGQIHQNELKFLAVVAKRVGLHEKQMKAVLSSPGSVKFTVPKAQKDRVCQLGDMIFMMMADGKIDQREMDRCMTLASRLGFPASTVPKMVATMVAGIKRGADQTKVCEDVGLLID